MIGVTVALLFRLELWCSAIVLLEGWLILLSWQFWDRATAISPASTRQPLVVAHYLALAFLPALSFAVRAFSIAESAISDAPSRPEQSTPLGVGTDMMSAHSLGIGLLWASGLTAALMKLLSELLRTYRVALSAKKAKSFMKVNHLIDNEEHAADVEICVAAVSTPQIVGIWKPALLVPPNFTVVLGKLEQEAILLHELAHIRRGDFGWNVLQRTLLAALWWHPAAWKLYTAVYFEREVRYDEDAVRGGASAKALACALVQLATASSITEVAMASAGQGELTRRIRRLLQPDEKCRSTNYSCAAAAAALFGCILIVLVGRLTLVDHSVNNLYLASAFGPTIFVEAQDPAGSFALRVRQGRVIEAFVGNTRLQRTQIIQDGKHVTLIGATQRSKVDLIVTPQDRIQWKARR